MPLRVKIRSSTIAFFKHYFIDFFKLIKLSFKEIFVFTRSTFFLKDNFLLFRFSLANFSSEIRHVKFLLQRCLIRFDLHFFSLLFFHDDCSCISFPFTCEHTFSPPKKRLHNFPKIATNSVSVKNPVFSSTFSIIRNIPNISLKKEKKNGTNFYYR